MFNILQLVCHVLPRHRQVTGRLPQCAALRPGEMVPKPGGVPGPVLQVEEASPVLQVQQQAGKVCFQVQGSSSESSGCSVAPWDQNTLIYTSSLLRLLSHLLCKTGM